MGLQAAFAAAWAECTGELISGDIFFPKKAFAPTQGGVTAGLFFSSPTTRSTPAERFIALSIASARRTLYVANSYFVPDDDFRKLLKQARARGVDVRILTVSKETDVKTTWWAGRSRYEELLRAGVRIYEYQPTMMHAKTFIVDGRWGSIGSMNFDNRSLAFNNESNLVFLDAALGAEMNATFMADIAHAREIKLDEFRRRGRWIRLVEAVSAARWRVAITLTGCMMAVYFGFILLVAFNKPLLGMRVTTGLSLGMLMGASVILVAWVLIWVYVRWANTHYDAALRKLRS
jgi:cardiolipin synthase